MNLLLSSAKHSAGEEGLLHVSLYRSATGRTDLSLILSWDTNTTDYLGSRIGQAVADTLKTFGLVEHSLWEEAG